MTAERETRLPTQHENNISALLARHRAGEKLLPGPMTKIIHLLSPDDQARSLPEIRSAQEMFWTAWAPFRFGLPGEGEPVFEDVIRLLPVRAEFAAFVHPHPEDLIVDLAGGSAQMAPYFARQAGNTLAGYITIDSHVSTYPLAMRHLVKELTIPDLSRAGFRVLIHDLNKGLPKLETIIQTSKPKHIRYVSNWGITYLAVPRFLALVNQCLDPERHQGIPSTLDMNMITEGQFNPDVLKRHFRREIVPRTMARCRVFPLLRAIRAVPLMREFGQEIQDVMPIWTPEEIRDILEGHSFTIVEENRSLLWGQSTAMRIGKKRILLTKDNP